MLERFLQLMPAIHSVVIFLTGELNLLHYTEAAAADAAAATAAAGLQVLRLCSASQLSAWHAGMPAVPIADQLLRRPPNCSACGASAHSAALRAAAAQVHLG